MEFNSSNALGLLPSPKITVLWTALVLTAQMYPVLPQSSKHSSDVGLSFKQRKILCQTMLMGGREKCPIYVGSRWFCMFGGSVFSSFLPLADNSVPQITQGGLLHATCIFWLVIRTVIVKPDNFYK